ncbi:NAD(+) synthase [Collinsella sp. An2]|uniref:NAD(+) synthase n=1 Tax=Collinsella sp. An2 TaxID=1965585 RepID=UPI000B3A8970|nr:NAD(+) synthase [Collinsella sp. An2]OUP08883.1 NAD(+) synthase [Collinsella sp. An2]
MDELFFTDASDGAGAGAGDGFFRIAAATPHIRVGDVRSNAEVALSRVRAAAEAGVGALALPELCLTGYTCADLFFDRSLQRTAEQALAWLLRETQGLPILFTVGVPVPQAGALYNCAAVCCAGQLLGLTAKQYLPNYGEFYERRWFTPAPRACRIVEFAGQMAPLGARIVYHCADAGMQDVVVGVEVCEDLWVADPPSVDMARAGATVILNASASDEIIGKAAYRRSLVSQQSACLYCAYVYADAGAGESTTDLVFAGENLVAENGSVLAQTPLFSCDMAVADVDLDRLMAERRRSTTWVGSDDLDTSDGCFAMDFSFAGIPGMVDALPIDGSASLFAADEESGAAAASEDAGAVAGDCGAGAAGDDTYATAGDPVDDPAALLMRSALDIDRVFPQTPFVPADAGDLAERCEEILNLQAAGLATRLAHTGTKHAVIGLSGGLDSTLALLVTVRAFDALDLPRTGITAVSMPGFGTTTRTKTNAQVLAEALEVSFREVPIGAAVEQHFSDIGHDPAVQDVTYENSQARERTQVLMDLANQQGGFVIGTGDLSELALGWATYNGDHMSMYAVNASVPKTLVRHLVRYAADVFGGQIEATLLDILDTPVSPELLPPTGDGEIAQRTEDLVGPYELHDFFLYYLLRFGFAPGKIFRMACRSFEGVYDRVTIHSWLRVFYRRFFAQQFKRSCLPDGPKVGSVTLSPRGDWRMPSDASARLWLAEIDSLA